MGAVDGCCCASVARFRVLRENALVHIMSPLTAVSHSASYSVAIGTSGRRVFIVLIATGLGLIPFLCGDMVFGERIG